MAGDNSASAMVLPCRRRELVFNGLRLPPSSTEYIMTGHLPLSNPLLARRFGFTEQ